MSVFRFIAAERANHHVKTLCRVLGVSRSGFHAWAVRAPSRRAREDALLLERIRELHAACRRTYGSPRIHRDLRADGVAIGRKRVERLMRTDRLSGVVKRRRGKTTIRVPGVRVADDLVKRDFRPPTPDTLWVADITYLRSWEGWLYLAVVLDCFSRRIVGFAIEDHLRAELVVDALEQSLQRRRPKRGLVHHSDQGSQGGFNWLSQRLVMEVVRDGCSGTASGDSDVAWPDVVAGPAVDCAPRGSAAVLAKDRGRTLERAGGCRGGSVAGGWQPVVPRRWRYAANLVGTALGALSLVR